MLRNKIILYIISLVFLAACIKPFKPKIESDTASKIVISGKLNNKEGYQSVTISKSIPLDDFRYQPVKNCSVSIRDNNGNEFALSEYLPGEYRVWMTENDLKVGLTYHLKIFTPEGDELESEPEIMTQVGSIKTPNFEIDSTYNGAFNYYTKGLQFLIDVEGDNTTSKFYLFDIDATYEHHAKYAREWYYDGSVHHIFPPDSSLMYCWTTERVPEIITLSTENLATNKFKNFKLHFVPLNKDYLTYGYSLLVTQIGLSRKAFLYWENMRLNNNQNASLYSKQPVDTQGNIYNLTHPEKEVLGFFSASAISQVRIFIESQPTNPYPECTPEPLGRLGFRQLDRTMYPAFLLNNPYGTYFMTWLDKPCVDCTALHGSTNKPDFWPY